MPDPQWAVIETNVLIAANRRSEQADRACEDKCIKVLQDVSATASVALDDGGEMLAEYAVYCNYSGEPGYGDEFFVWLYDNQYSLCLRVPLTPREDGRRYEEFPDIQGLSEFDPGDHKWVATALGCDPTAAIYNAVDSDYTESAAGLAEAGVPVVELCPGCLKTERRKR